jgi:acetyl-CoA acyltransferase 2
MSKPSIVFVAAKRTPFGTFGGALKDWSATDLAVHAAKAAFAQSNVSPEEIDHVIFGNVMQTSADAIYLARHVGLKSGVPVAVPALTVNRLCGSGFEAIVLGAQQILLGESKTVLVGGTESMSQAPHTVRGARWGIQLGKSASAMGDSLWDALTDSYTGMPMAITAENLAEKYTISREETDAYGLLSQQRWSAAQAAGRFNSELAVIEIPTKKGVTRVEKDEHPRPETTIESLKKLPPVFKKEGTVTAGSASGIGDGAAALIMTTEENAKARGWKILGRLVSWGVSGCDPKIMGIGPAPAARAALKRAGLELSQMDLVEVNEAFAAQYIAVEKELGLDREKTNVDGGAIALAHPLAASGARITTHLLYAVAERKKRYALGSACIGGGQGIAVIIEG